MTDERDERLKKLSDLVRQGIPIDIYDAVEVIEYQEAKKLQRTTADIRSRFAQIMLRITSYIRKRCTQFRQRS